MADQEIGSLTLNDVIYRFNAIQIALNFDGSSFIISKQEILDNYERVFDVLNDESNEGICVITNACAIDKSRRRYIIKQSFVLARLNDALSATESEDKSYEQNKKNMLQVLEDNSYEFAYVYVASLNTKSTECKKNNEI